MILAESFEKGWTPVSYVAHGIDMGNHEDVGSLTYVRHMTTKMATAKRVHDSTANVCAESIPMVDCCAGPGCPELASHAKSFDEVQTPLHKHLVSILAAKCSIVKASTDRKFSKVASLELRGSPEVI